MPDRATSVYRCHLASQLVTWSGIAAAALVAAGGCTSVNVPLNSQEVQLEARKRNHTRATTLADVAPVPEGAESRTGPEVRAPAVPEADDVAALPDADGTFVGIAISGGGSRSANFAAACMFHLQRLGLLRRVDYISSVSGGSLTAALYCLSDDDEWNPGNVQRELTHSFASDVIFQTLLPWNSVALFFSHFDRSDLLADSFRANLFTRDGRELTFGDLRADRPRLLINATDLQSGRRFVFSDETFDDINSDLSRYPISYAVAASAAVPILMHHVTLRNYATTFEQYRHLVDGGVTDNLGVQTLVETYTAQVESARRAERADPYPNGAVFIVLDATTRYDARLSSLGDIGFVESLATGAGLTSTALLNRASSATLAELIVRNAPDGATAKTLRGQIRELEAAGYLSIEDRTGHRVRVVHLALTKVDDLTDVPFESFGESVNSIATYFNIDATEAFHLYQAAELLVEEKFEQPLTEIVAELERRTGRVGATTEPAQR